MEPNGEAEAEEIEPRLLGYKMSAVDFLEKYPDAWHGYKDRVKTVFVEISDAIEAMSKLNGNLRRLSRYLAIRTPRAATRRKIKMAVQSVRFGE